jgi:hypothetical protein
VSADRRREPSLAGREAALFGLLAGFLLLIGSLVGFVWIATALVDGFSGAGWSPTAADLTPGAGHAAGLRILLGLVFWGIAVSALALPGILAWKRWGPAAPGHAGRADVAAELSLAAARNKAPVTRPVLARHLGRAELRGLPGEEVGAPCHRSLRGPMLVSPFENPSGSLAPTQTGKSRKDLVHKAIAAPGALLCSTSKPDLLEFAALSRARRAGAGPVVVIDATNTVAWPARAGWRFLDGCGDPRVAERRAHTMVEAAAAALTNQPTGNDVVFRERATKVLKAYFLATCVGRRGVGDLLRWALTSPLLHEPAELLKDAGWVEYAANLRSEMGMVPETRDAVWLSVRRVLEPMLDPTVRALVEPAPGCGLDVAGMIARGGSVFLIAGEHQAAHAAPLLTALAEQWIATGQELALHTEAGRLDPPATAVLDEVTNATPIPKLPEFISDTAGRGVPIHWAAQSIPALEDAWGPIKARMLISNSVVLSVWGGLRDKHSLDELSVLTGHHERIKHQQHHDGALGTGRSSLSTETVPTYRPGDIRGIRRDRVLVLHRQLDPILARPIDVTDRDDWPTIEADIDTIRAGDAPVDAGGYWRGPGDTAPIPVVRLHKPTMQEGA